MGKGYDKGRNDSCDPVFYPVCLALSQMAKSLKNASPKPQQNENPPNTP